MLDLKKWMVKVGKKLAITTADYTATVGNSLYQGFYIADITLTKSNPAAIWVYVSNANRPAFAQRIDNSHVRVNCSVANTPVTVRCLYIPGVGVVISYLIHLTESLKSFCGRRWAYAEHQEVADKAVRTDKLSLCRDLCRESKYSSESDKVDNNLDTHQREAYRNLRLVFLSNRPQYVQRATSRGWLFDCLAESHKCSTDDKYKSVLYHGRLTTIPGEGVMAC